MSEEELDQVAGGYRSEFNEIAGLVGGGSRNSVRATLLNQYGIDVVHWNTGDLGSSKKDFAEFTADKTLTVKVIDADTEKVRETITEN